MFAVLNTIYVGSGCPKHTFGLFLLSIFDTNYCGVEPPCIDCNGLCVHVSVLSNGKGDTVFLLPVVKCLIQMSTKRKSMPIPFEKESITDLQFYIKGQQDVELEQFRQNFKKLPRKIQYLIIRLVKEIMNAEKLGLTEYADKFSCILGFFDTFCVLNYSPFKIKGFVKQLYL